MAERERERERERRPVKLEEVLVAATKQRRGSEASSTRKRSLMSSSESSLTSRPHSIRRGRPTRDCPRVQGASEGLGHVLDGGHSSAAVENEKKKRKREQKRQRKTKQKPKKKQTINMDGWVKARWLFKSEFQFWSNSYLH